MVSRCMVIVDWLSTKMGKIKVLLLKAKWRYWQFCMILVVSFPTVHPHIIHLFLSFKNI